MPTASSGTLIDSVNAATVWFSFAVPRLLEIPLGRLVQPRAGQVRLDKRHISQAGRGCALAGQLQYSRVHVNADDRAVGPD
jgi:hypothetical protein